MTEINISCLQLLSIDYKNFLGTLFVVAVFLASRVNHKDGIDFRGHSIYRSGYCNFSFKIPCIVSIILFLFPYKRKVPGYLVIIQSIWYTWMTAMVIILSYYPESVGTIEKLGRIILISVDLVLTIFMFFHSTEKEK